MLEEDTIMKNSIEKNEMITEEIRQILARFDLRPKHCFSDGNSGALVLRCDSKNGDNLVLKVSTDDRSEEEIKVNEIGYRRIKEEGLEQILPTHLVTGIECGRRFILMSYLGNSFKAAVQLEKDPLRKYKSLLDLLKPIYKATLKSDEKGSEFLETLKKYLLARYCGALIPAGYIPEKAAALVSTINCASLGIQKSTFACFDFTPEDVFIEGGVLKYPDPKADIRGIPLIDLACFAGVTRDIYQLPESVSAYSLFENYAIHELGDLFGISHFTAKKVFCFGRAIQLAISAKVRIKTEPKRARYFAEQSVRYLQED